ncbi:MAG: LysM peptidoglycan-binding domain-containing protein [Syntrophobacterales bacterium]|nr:LysM peptidoglycan-binding domain-containing protein [Syntrophobacterales bacterium]
MFKLKRLIPATFIVIFLSSCILPNGPILSPYPGSERVKASSEQVTESSQLSHDNPEARIVEEDLSEESVQDISEGKKSAEPNTSEQTEPNQKNHGQNNKQAIMDEALDFLDQAQLLWEKGEIEKALELLDEAYYLLLDINGDPEIAWQKDDLRVMIAKKIVEIYASRSNVAAGYQSEIPLIINDDVKKAIRRFQRSERKFFISSYKRSGRYRPMILEQLREAGLPEELSWLPLVESGFKIRALSKARALGLWQIIPSTGYMYGLKRDHWIDERMDPEKSTRAAIAYLKELHGIFGDWLTVLAAYNCGEGRVLRAISKQHVNYLDDFWDLYHQLPTETSSYVPRFLATLQILKNPEKYGMDLNREQEKPVPFDIVKTKKSVRLKDVAKGLHTSEKTLNFLNSELRYKTTPNTYDLKIPSGMEKDLALVIDKIPKAKRPGGAKYIRYKVKKGDTLSVLSRRYRSSVNAIIAANHLTSKHSIRAGKWLKIPSRGYVYSKKPRKPVFKEGDVAAYRVKKGDSLWLIARRFDTTVSEIKRLNGLRQNNLTIGQVIRIRSSSAGDNVVSAKTCVVKKGDTLSSIALKKGIGLDKLLKLNNFNKSTLIHPGQLVIVR